MAGSFEPPMMAASSSVPPQVAALPIPQLGHLDLWLTRLFSPPIALAPAEVRVVLAFAGVFAVVTDVLFQRASIGINVALWFGSLVGMIAFAGYRLGRPLPAARLAVLGLAVLLSSITGWRDSVALQMFGLLGTLGLLGIGVGLPRTMRVTGVSPITAVMALVQCGASLANSWWRLASRFPRPAMLSSGSRVPGTAALRSLVIAAPLLLMFGALFVAADAVFEAQVSALLDFEFPDIGSHLALLLFGAWFGTAALSSAVAVEWGDEVVVAPPERNRLKPFEVAIILGTLAALFALFVLVQVRYLFGGEEAVQTSVSLTYSEYARRGFFELVTASLLLLPVLASIDWARQRSPHSMRLFLMLAVVLVALLAVIMVSAWERLAMYREAFGLTELRFYAATTLPWIALALAWFLVCAAHDRVEQFLPGAAGLAAGLLLGLYVLSPDDFIVRTNAGRIEEQRPFDAYYASRLSADAVPALLDHLDVVPEGDRCAIVGSLRAHARASEDLREWNFSRQRAAVLVADLEASPVCRK